ncbi:MAG: cysteine--tRNA ligase [Cyclobacteriaceae bacterium]|nr:cysteine--tRNA ligase [Cyclobacteriaceae bacterium]
MQNQLRVYNSLTRKKEIFEPNNPPFVGMYVCGPTVYSDVHLGNVRTFLSFDIIYRYLKHLGYKVRYVRNITDVGHLESDADEGEDKISKKARLENLEPMEIVQRYSNDFHQVMAKFNILDPDIEPSATGHIQEQIKMIERLVEKGFAYEVNGSVYFDVLKYNEKEKYGILSGRVLEELMTGSRALDGQEEKRNSVDFALWKKANPSHIMRWDSSWSTGFPGWHLECSVMSSKYLGETFDIHGGGMDLKFPHHECEIAQSVGATGKQPVKYWLHTNMLTINGQKMSKSLGNSFLPEELFNGSHELLNEPYSPMTVRFFMLQSHYSSTLDFSNDALKAAAKGYKKMINGLVLAKNLQFVKDNSVEINEKTTGQINGIIDNCYRALNDDFNTAQAIAHIFNLLKKINSISTGNLKCSEIGEEIFNKLMGTYSSLVENVLGLWEEKPTDVEGIINIIIDLYKQAKQSRDYDKVDEIRLKLKQYGVVLKDMKESVGWAYEEQ